MVGRVARQFAASVTQAGVTSNLSFKFYAKINTGFNRIDVYLGYVIRVRLTQAAS